MSTVVRATSPRSWTSQIPDQFRLNELMIPGTHDSGTEPFTPGNYSRTQDQTIVEQLDMGVRFLDIRLGSDGNIYHSSDPTGTSLTQLFQWLKDFFQQSGSERETVIVSIKHEGSSSDPPNPDNVFAAQVKTWIDNSGLSWYHENRIPWLGEVRGKVVLVRRYTTNLASLELGMDFSIWGPVHDNDSFQHKVGDIVVGVQDEYKLSEASTKEDYVSKLLPNMARLETQNWYINFTSAAKAMEPYTIAWGAGSGGVNTWLTGKLKDYKQLHGVFMMDFVSSDLARLVFDRNRLSTAYVLSVFGVVWAQAEGANGNHNRAQELTPKGQRFATDMSVGVDGTLWIVSNEKSPGGFKIKYLGPASFLAAGVPESTAVDFSEKAGTWVDMPDPIAAKKIAGGLNGQAYVINDKGIVFSIGKDGSAATLSAEQFAQEISVGGDGTLWVVTTEKVDGGYKVQYREPVRDTTNKITGLADTWSTLPDAQGIAVTRIAGTHDGKLLAMNDKGIVVSIDKHGNATKIDTPEVAHDIGVGANGTMWIITAQTGTTKAKVKFYEPLAKEWIETTELVNAQRITVR